jgi:trans-aconitate methyltransferase
MRILGLLKTTNRHRQYWKNRKINWVESYLNPDHPHRKLIVETLRQFKFRSVLELGCAAGANLYNIKKAFPWADIGGIDWNADAIETAKKVFPGASVFQVGEATDVYLGTKGADIILTDMAYIYLDRKNFAKAIQEAKRTARNGVIFCEFHSPSYLKRIALKAVSGYNAYDYQQTLTEAGFHDIQMRKLTE